MFDWVRYFGFLLELTKSPNNDHVIQFPCLYLHYNTILMLVNFGSRIWCWLPDVGSSFYTFPIFSNTTGRCGLKADQPINFTSDSNYTIFKELETKTNLMMHIKQHLNLAAWHRLLENKNITAKSVRSSQDE